MPSEGGKGIDPVKSKSVLGTVAGMLLKGGLQAANEIRRESAERGVRDAEAAEEQARDDRRALEEELRRDRAGLGGGEVPPAACGGTGAGETPTRPTADAGDGREGTGMENLTGEQHDYLLAACRAAEGKGGDEVIIGEGRVTGPAGVDDRREAEVLGALRERGMLRHDFGTDKAYLTPAGARYCDRHGDGTP